MNLFQKNKEEKDSSETQLLFVSTGKRCLEQITRGQSLLGCLCARVYATDTKETVATNARRLIANILREATLLVALQSKERFR